MKYFIFSLLFTSLTTSAALVAETASCGEANAFYSPGDRMITMCTEYEDYLFEMAETQ